MVALLVTFRALHPGFCFTRFHLGSGHRAQGGCGAVYGSVALSTSTWPLMKIPLTPGSCIRVEGGAHRYCLADSGVQATDENPEVQSSGHPAGELLSTNGNQKKRKRRKPRAARVTGSPRFRPRYQIFPCASTPQPAASSLQFPTRLQFQDSASVQIAMMQQCAKCCLSNFYPSASPPKTLFRFSHHTAPLKFSILGLVSKQKFRVTAPLACPDLCVEYTFWGPGRLLLCAQHRFGGLSFPPKCSVSFPQQQCAKQFSRLMTKYCTKCRVVVYSPNMAVAAVDMRVEGRVCPAYVVNVVCLHWASSIRFAEGSRALQAPSTSGSLNVITLLQCSESSAKPLLSPARHGGLFCCNLLCPGTCGPDPMMCPAVAIDAINKCRSNQAKYVHPPGPKRKPVGAPQAQCARSAARSATIWASGCTRDPYFEILGAPRGIMVTPSGGFDF